MYWQYMYYFYYDVTCIGSLKNSVSVIDLSHSKRSRVVLKAPVHLLVY